MRQITIELPDIIEISGADDAPEKYRSIKTEKWNEEFCLAALEQGVSLKIRNTWSVGKKDVQKLKECHEALEDGQWNRRNRGVSTQKFDEAIKKLNAHALTSKLTREQLAELAAIITPNGEVKF